MTRPSGRGPGALAAILFLATSLLVAAPASARDHSFQITLLPTFSWMPGASSFMNLTPGSTSASDLMNELQGDITNFGAGASLQLSYEALTRDAFSGFVWIQGGIATSPIDVRPKNDSVNNPATSQLDILLYETLLLGVTFRLNIDRLAFEDRSARLGARFELGLGITGVQLSPQSEPIVLTNADGSTKVQSDMALIQGRLNVSAHLGIGLDYQVTRRWMIGIGVGWELPFNFWEPGQAITTPTVTLIRAADGSLIGFKEQFGYLTLGPRLSLRL